MKQRGNRRKRILVVVGVGAVLAVAAVGAYFVRRWQFDRSAIASRDAGMQALAEGDNEAALDGLGSYILRFGERRATSEDWTSYAKARKAVPAPNGEHVAGAISAYRKAIELDPSARAAQDDLLKLYGESGYFSEALALAEQMLRTAPADAALLRTQADVLEALRRFPEALAVAKTLCAQPNPSRDDLFRTCRLLIRSATPEGEVDLWLGATASVRPGDPFVDLLQAIVLYMRGDAAAANARIDQVVAASETSGDPELRLYLLRTLDETHRFVDAVGVMRRMVDVKDAGLRREIVRRLWFAGEPKEVLARSEAWNTDLKATEPELLAIHALALRWLGRGADAGPQKAELASRTDPIAKAWASLVAMDSPEGPVPADASVRILTEALAAVPESGLFLCALGDARAATGELDAAIRVWTSATRKAPSWYLPFARLARAYRSVARPALALEAARAAVDRSPRSLDAMAVWVDVNADAADSLDATQMSVFLQQLAAAQTAVPGLADVVLPVRVELLARTDATGAKVLIEALLSSPAGASEAAILRIAGAAAQTRLGSVDRILGFCEKLHGVTPRLAMTAAVLHGRGDRKGDALATFDAYRARSTAGPNGAEWSVARAGLLEAAGRPEAAAAWAEVADANPASVAIQLAALSAPSTWNDRSAVARAVDRMKGLTGESGVMWRLSRARLLLDAPNATEREAADAADVLKAALRDAPDNTYAHVLLGRALQMTGDMSGAEEHMQAAFRLAPENTWIALDLARLAQWRGEPEEARRKIDVMLASRTLAPQQAEGAAYLLAAQGDLQRSADLLHRLVREHRADPAATLELSRICARLGRIDDAIRLSESLLDQPTAPVIEHTAGLYASAGRSADADRLLRVLGELQLPAGDAELIRARHAARWGAPGSAIAGFQAAIAAVPARADAWTALIAHAVATGDKAALAAALDDSRTAAIEPAQFLRSVREICDFSLADAGLRRLLLAAIAEPPQRPAITQALRVIAQDWPDPSKRAQTAKTVRGLAEANVKVAVLQMVAVDVCAQTSEIHAAVEFSRRTAAAFPNSPEAARQWAELVARTGQWNRALEAARDWRSRAAPQDSAPDELIARMLLRLGRTPEAAVALQPRVAAAIERPADHEALLVTHAIVLLRTGETARLSQLFRQLAATSDRWRGLPLTVGPEFLGTSAEAVTWLGICNEIVPANDVSLRIQLAQAWAVAWKAFRTADLLAGANAILADLRASSNPPATAHFLAGTIAEASGDSGAATAAYEAALRVNPDFAQAENNLAMVLATAGRWEEAVEHAKRVVKAAPRSASALDTLAYALRKGGKFAEARSRLGEAIGLDPANPEWHVSLAETLAAAGETEPLTVALQRLRKMEEDGVTIRPDLSARIDRIRSKRQ